MKVVRVQVVIRIQMIRVHQVIMIGVQMIVDHGFDEMILQVVGIDDDLILGKIKIKLININK